MTYTSAVGTYGDFRSSFPFPELNRFRCLPDSGKTLLEHYICTYVVNSK